MQNQLPSPRHGSSSPLPVVPGIDRSDSYPRGAPSGTRRTSSSTSGTSRGSLPQMPQTPRSDYASCDEQMPSHHPGYNNNRSPPVAGAGNPSSSFDLPMPPSPHGSRENNSSGEGRRSKQIFVQRTTYVSSASGEKRKDTMTWSYVSSESESSSRPSSQSKSKRQTRSQGNRIPMPTNDGDDPFNWFADQQEPARSRPSTYSEGLHPTQVHHHHPTGASVTRPAPGLSQGMEVVYEDSDSDMSFCDVVEQEPDRPSTAVLVQQHQQQQEAQQNAFGHVPGVPELNTGACGALPPVSGRGSGRNVGQGTSPQTGGDLPGLGASMSRGGNAPSFAIRYRGTVKSYSKQNENSVGNNSGHLPGDPPSSQIPTVAGGGIKALRKKVTSSRVDQPQPKSTAPSNTRGKKKVAQGQVRTKPTTSASARSRLARQHLFDDDADSSDAFDSSSSFSSSGDESGVENYSTSNGRKVASGYGVDECDTPAMEGTAQ